MKVFLVLKAKNTNGGKFDFEIQGIFSTEERAAAACRGCNFSYEAFTVDEEMPVEAVVGNWTFPNDEGAWIE